MHILANGCSNTYGAGLFEKITTTGFISHEDDLQRQQLSWPGQLGQLFNAESVTNLGASCGSNQRIIRTTLEWCLKQPKHILENTVAIIQWTHGMRYEQYVPKVRDRDFSKKECPTIEISDPDPNRWAKVMIGIRTGMEMEMPINGYDVEELSQLRYLMWTPEEGMYRDIECYSSLDSIFRIFGVRYFYYHFIGYNLSHTLDQWVKKSFNWVDTEKPNASGWKFDTLPCTHPSAAGHRTIAENIYEHIKDRLNI